MLVQKRNDPVFESAMFFSNATIAAAGSNHPPLGATKPSYYEGSPPPTLEFKAQSRCR
jgi:hypothetical protein